MNRKHILKLAFSSLLLTTLLISFATTAVSAKAAPHGCPISVCPVDLSGYTKIGQCHFTNLDGCVFECEKWRSPSGSFCKRDCWSH